jgi:hypothetical protein
VQLLKTEACTESSSTKLRESSRKNPKPRFGTGVHTIVGYAHIYMQSAGGLWKQGTTQSSDVTRPQRFYPSRLIVGLGTQFQDFHLLDEGVAVDLEKACRVCLIPTTTLQSTEDVLTLEFLSRSKQA